MVDNQYLEDFVVSHVKKNIMEAKPIFIVRLPRVYKDNVVLQLWEALEKKFIGYYVFCLVDRSIDEIQFECYNSRDLDDITFEELKKIALSQINKEGK